MIHKELISLVRDVLLLRENFVIGAFNEKLVERHRNFDEDIILLLLDGNKLDFSVILSNLVVSQEVHEIKSEDCVHFLRVRDERAEMFIIVSSQYVHVLLVLLDVLFLNTQEGGVFVYFTS